MRGAATASTFLFFCHPQPVNSYLGPDRPDCFTQNQIATVLDPLCGTASPCPGGEMSLALQDDMAAGLARRAEDLGDGQGAERALIVPSSEERRAA
jgi:hypothetical protein